MFKKTLKTISLTLVAVLSLTMAFTSGASAARINDGISYQDCRGRYLIKSISYGTTNMFVYGCSNSYAFVQLNSRTNKSKNAQIARLSNGYPTGLPYSNQIASGYYYAVTTPMVGMLPGYCYLVRGWTTENGSASYGFCR